MLDLTLEQSRNAESNCYSGEDWRHASEDSEAVNRFPDI